MNDEKPAVSEAAKWLWIVVIFFVLYIGAMLYTGDLVWVGIGGKE